MNQQIKKAEDGHIPMDYSLDDPKARVDKVNEIIDSIGGSGGSVTSVNGQTGDVTLTASDVGITEYTANEVDTLWNSI